MRITRLRTDLVQVPLPRPIPSAKLIIRTAGCVLVTLETDEGLVGEGLCFSLNGARLDVLHAMVRSFEPLILGVDPSLSGAFLAQAQAGLMFFGHGGISAIGLAPIDMALWDLRGKQAGLNVARLLGARAETVPIYASGGLRLSAGIDDLQAEAAEVLGRGFRALKMSLGKPDPADDVARVRAVREAVGQDVMLMADANQQLTVPGAIRLGRMLEEFRLAWIEEPVPYTDHEGEAAIAAALDTPIASGETEYRAGLLEMLKLRSADILMPDLQRLAGPTGLIALAQAAAARNVPVTPHLFTEMSLSLAAFLPNAMVLENMPWFRPLYRETLEMDPAGHAVVPTRPGWGFTFDPGAVAHFKA
jgi:L-alanine-DL-glutamate epimerase-like enolase superfamily enzyme